MTMPYGGAEEPIEVMEEPAMWAPEVVSTHHSKSIAPEFGSWRTFPLLPTSLPTRILNRSLRRHRAFLRVNASQPTGNVPSVTVEGTATNPGAGGIIASISAAAIAAAGIPNGALVVVQWQVSLQGTVTAADADNMRIASPLGTLKEVALYPGVVGNYPQDPFNMVWNTGNDVTVTATAAASGASAIYGAQISLSLANPTSGGQANTDGILLCNRDIANQAVNPSLGTGLFYNGGYIPIGEDARYEAQQELWAVPLINNSALVYVSVLDEQYASDPWSNDREGR